MTRNRVLAAVAAFGLLLGVAGVVRADVVTLQPGRAVLLPADESGEARVALWFDLSGLRAGAGRWIDEALLEWTMGDLSPESTTNLTVRAIASDWTAETAARGSAKVSAAEGVVDRWRIDAPSLAWTKGRVRLELTELVGSWAAEPSANHGVVVSFGSLPRTGVSGVVELPRLTVRYGFMK